MFVLRYSHIGTYIVPEQAPKLVEGVRAPEDVVVQGEPESTLEVVVLGEPEPAPEEQVFQVHHCPLLGV